VDVSLYNGTVRALERFALAELAHLVADAIVEAHLPTRLRLEVAQDVLPRESETLHLPFWAAACLMAARSRDGRSLRNGPPRSRPRTRVLF
jgi:hypothetical protein